MTLKWPWNSMYWPQMTFNCIYNAIIMFYAPKLGMKHVSHLYSVVCKKSIIDITRIWRPSWKWRQNWKSHSCRISILVKTVPYGCPPSENIVFKPAHFFPIKSYFRTSVEGYQQYFLAIFQGFIPRIRTRPIILFSGK